MCTRLITLLMFFSYTGFAEVDYEKMLHSSCKFYDFMRSPNGVYFDNIRNSTPDSLPRKNMISSASTGAGLISLTIAHELGFDENAEKKVIASLRFLNGKEKVKPVRNKNGLFLHFFDWQTGDFHQREFSTIDTALLISGAIFCKNVFDNSEIKNEVDQLWNSIKWQTFKVDDMQYFMTQDEDGRSLTKTKMFNEYILLADYCSIASGSKPLQINENWIQCRIEGTGISVLSDLKNRMLPLFTFQFPLYLSPVRTNENSFLNHSLRAAKADRQWWENKIKVTGIWGSSAGSAIHGYGVDATGKNHHLNIHAPSVMGFAPFRKQYKDDFETILKTYPAIIQKHKNWEIAWRHSLKNPDWPARTIQSIDLSPLLYGLAALHPKLGYKFFKTNSQYEPVRD